MSDRTPRLAGWLLAACLPADAVEGALGDLEEELLATTRAGGGPGLWTHLLYWREILSLCAGALHARWRARRSTPRSAARRGAPWAGTAKDLRFALRLLRRRPWTAWSAVGSLALGIALNAVMLAVLHAAWVQSVPYPEADRLVSVQSSREGRPGSRFGMSSADFVAWRDATDVFQSFGASVSFGSFDLTGDGDPARLDRHLATAGYFAALGTPPLIGRTFIEADENPGADRVVVLAYPLWQSRFGGERSVLGRTILLDGEPYAVVGVMPKGFGVRGGTPDLWAPLRFGSERPLDRRTFYLVGVARLRDGVPLAAARAQLETVSRRVSAQLPEDQRNLVALAQPLRAVMTATVRPLLTLLLGAVVLVLLMVSLNVANLLTTLRLGRAEELAVRSALGAGRMRLVRQTLVEGSCVALLGGLAGTGLSLVGARLLPDLRDTVLHGYVEVRVNLWVIALSLALSLGCAVVVGLLPSLALPPGRLAGSPAAGGGRVAGGPVSLSVVVLQTALCVLLLVAAGTTVTSVLRMQALDLGYRHAEVLSAELSLPRSRYPSGDSAVAFGSRLLEEVARRPRVESVALSGQPPGGGWSFGPSVLGRSADPGVSARFEIVSRGYFETIGLRLAKGRAFAAADSHGPRVAVLNKTAARQLFPDADPLGESITLDGPERWYEIVGVVDDVLSDPAAPVGAAAYFLRDQALLDLPLEEAELRQCVLLLRTADGGRGLWAEVAAALHAVDPNMPLGSAATLGDRMARKLFRPRLSSGLFSLFGAIALALSALGLYGVVSLAVRLRGRELAIRLALGARPRELIARLVVRGLGLSSSGALLGLAAAWLLRNRLAGLLPDEGAFDRSVLLAAPLLLIAVGLLASWLPARRVLGVDPAVSLRAE